MSFLRKFVRNIRIKHYSKISFTNSVTCLQSHSRNFHDINSKLFSKLRMEYENQYAYSILETKGYTITKLSVNDVNSALLTTEEFQDALKVDWSKKSHSEIFDMFSRLGEYCAVNSLKISDNMFDDYIDNLTDNIKFASDEELVFIFNSLNKWPEIESVKSRNYIEIWVALDDECMKRMKEWSYDKLLMYVTLFYMSNVIKNSDYCIKSLQKLTTKAKQLTLGQFVQTLFFIGIWRKQPFEVHNLEINLSTNFSQYSIDEIAIISMGFFKSKTPIRDMALVLKIINLIIDNAKDIHEVSLAALLKLIRYSTKMTTDNRIHRLLDVLQHEVSRLSVMCNVHVALVATSTLTLHRNCLTEIAKTISKSIATTRIKDLERLVLTYGTFNLTLPTNDSFFLNVLNELRKQEREAEIIKHGRSFACCVAYLSLLEIYPIDLINKVLSSEFLENTYGKQCYFYGREVLTLHNVSKIFCADANINSLSDKEVKILAKKYTDYVPSEDYQKQYSIAERFMLDILKVLKESRGGGQYVVGYHILPHYQRGDIIICNTADGTPVAVEDSFKTEHFGLLQRPPDNNHWVALVIVGRNALLYDSLEPTGHFRIKIKELEALGFHAELVPWNLYNKLVTVEEKTIFLNKLIDKALKKSK